MSPQQMRKELYAFYDNPSWRTKVDRMSDKQVAAVLMRLQSDPKHKHHN